ncbi:MAG TPA: DUF2782 domain-containing protein [Gammaproteobacteria bacterium]
MRAAHSLLLFTLLPAAAPLCAEEFAPVPPPPAMEAAPASEAPVPPAEGEAMPEPEVTIIKRKEEIIEEYRLNGQLYMVKITPSKGYPYYLIDTDGDGSLETRRNELDNPPVIQWKILQW